MGFEEASKKYARLILLIFGSTITCFLYMIPSCLDVEHAKMVEASRSEWMIVYTMIVVFYFKEKEDK